MKHKWYRQSYETTHAYFEINIPDLHIAFPLHRTLWMLDMLLTTSHSAVIAAGAKRWHDIERTSQKTRSRHRAAWLTNPCSKPGDSDDSERVLSRRQRLLELGPESTSIVRAAIAFAEKLSKLGSKSISTIEVLIRPAKRQENRLSRNWVSELGSVDMGCSQN